MASATIRTVSNNPSTLGQFNTIQGAIVASSDGDAGKEQRNGKGRTMDHDVFLLLRRANA